MKKYFAIALSMLLAVSFVPASYAADLTEAQPVALWDGTNFLGEGTADPVYTTLVDAAGDQIAISAAGNLSVDIASGGGGTEYNEDDATPATIVGTASLMERDDALATLTPIEGDWVGERANARGAKWVAIDDTDSVSIDDNGGSVTVDGTVAATQSGTWNVGTVTTLTGITNDVNIADGGNSITVDATALDIRALTNADVVTVEQATHDSLNANVNLQVNDTDVSSSNPVPTTLGDPVASTTEVHDYDTAVAVVKDASSNHDYTVTGTTAFISRITITSSGAAKVEIQSGPLASLTTKKVVFTSSANPTEQVVFNPPLEVPVTSTGTVRVIRTNKARASQDLYSTIEGWDI